MSKGAHNHVMALSSNGAPTTTQSSSGGVAQSASPQDLHGLASAGLDSAESTEICMPVTLGF